MSRSVPHYSREWLETYRNRREEAQTATPPKPRAKRLVPYAPAKCAKVPIRTAPGKQTATEKRYNRDCLGGRGRFEAVSLRLPGGGRYTPDFMTIDDGGVVTFHEVKGSYRLGSQGRAYTAFHEAAACFPMWRFVWAKWTGKAWERSVLADAGEDSENAENAENEKGEAT